MRADGIETVQLGLMLPTAQAAALVGEIREAKRAGEPAAININAMHIKMIASTGDMPDSPAHGRVFRVKAPRRTSTLVRLGVAAVGGGVGAALWYFLPDTLGPMVIGWAAIAWYGTR